MVFSSIPFLYYFLPCVCLLYFLAPRCLKNTVLFLASLFFYGWGEPKYVIVMVLVIITGYLCGLGIGHFRKSGLSKALLCISILVPVGMLFYFKYMDFFLENFSKVTGISVKLLGIALPVGISFYTFQILSYVIDVYRGTVPAQKNPILLGTYVAMFPQLIAGPIVRYSDIEKQLCSRKENFTDISIGIRRFVIGLSKKVLLSNALGELCSIAQESQEKAVLFYWLYAVAFTLQIYFDFSGYSDMAIGLGKIFGFSFPENFQYPYISKSITEFWRRWHISLGSWFRDYVYIPLGGNRTSIAKWIRNLFIVWLLTGIWHGAAWNFIVWGLMYGVLLLVEKLFLGRLLSKGGIWNHVYVLFFVVVGFVIFHADTMADAVSCLKCMFGLGKIPVWSGEFVYYLKSFGWILVIGFIGATPIPKKIQGRICENRTGQRICNVLEIFVLFGLLIVVTAYLVDGSFNPFLYFRF